MAASASLLKYLYNSSRLNLVTRGFSRCGILHNSDSQDRTSSSSHGVDTQKFDVRMLEHLACPLSKEPLRYDEEAQELICDSLGVAYPIRNGLPNFIPTDARKLPSSK